MSPVIERAVVFGSDRSLVGIVTEPSTKRSKPDAPAVLLLNAGFLHRVGPNLLYVKLARRLAMEGWTTLRFDFSGVGDSRASTSDAPLNERMVSEGVLAMDFLARMEQFRTFIPIGICSGADVGLAVADRDQRVVGAALINPNLMDSKDSAQVTREAQARIRARYYRKRLMNPYAWSRFVRLQSNTNAVLQTLKSFLRKRKDVRRFPPSAALSEAIRRLGERQVELLTVFSEGSIAWDIGRITFGAGARRLVAFGNVQLEYFANCDHVFTPLALQERLMDTVLLWIRSRFIR